jgi:hypothetical protein
LNPNPKLQLLGSVYFLSKQSEKDGVYSPGMAQTRPTRKEFLFTSTAKTIGQQYAFEVAYFYNKNWSFYADCAYFAAGKFVKETGKGQNITYLSAKTAFKF